MLQRIQEQTGFCGALDSQPELDPYLQSVWISFWRLSNARQFGENGVPQPVSISSICSYIQTFPVLDKEEFLEFVQGMDNVYMNHAAKKQRQKK